MSLFTRLSSFCFRPFMTLTVDRRTIHKYLLHLIYINSFWNTIYRKLTFIPGKPGWPGAPGGHALEHLTSEKQFRVILCHSIQPYLIVVLEHFTKNTLFITTYVDVENNMAFIWFATKGLMEHLVKFPLTSSIVPPSIPAAPCKQIHFRTVFTHFQENKEQLVD